MKTLEELRKEIDEIDKELHNLLVRRIEIGQEVAKAKKINSGLNLRPGREAQIMKRLVSEIRRCFRQLLFTEFGVRF